MTGSGWIEGQALEGLLPHRGVNLLIDAVRLSGEQGAEGALRVSRGDPRGRDIFLRRGEAGRDCLMEPALAEHLALNATCVLSRELGPGEVALFSRVSGFRLAREASAGERLISQVKRLRDKGSFRRFDGTVAGEAGDVVARGEIMAYVADPSDAGKGEARKAAAPPEVGEARPVDRGPFGWKRPEMVFVDELVSLAEDGRQATFRYTYPPEHPFCPGHFPDAPVMMGVAQWMAACDAAAWLVHGGGGRSTGSGRRREVERSNGGEPGREASGSGRFGADAEILRESGALVADVRGLVLGFGPAGSVVQEGGGIAPLRVEATRRLGFRDLVRPGETIFVRVRLAPDGQVLHRRERRDR